MLSKEEKLQRQRAYGRQYREQHRESINAYASQWFKKNSKQICEKREPYRKAYYIANREWILEKGRKRRKETHDYYRAEIIKALGGKCERCGISDIRVLEIHHLLGGGAKIRESYKGTKYGYDYRYLRDILKNLEGISLLCANCHLILAGKKELEPL